MAKAHDVLETGHAYEYSRYLVQYMQTDKKYPNSNKNKHIRFTFGRGLATLNNNAGLRNRTRRLRATLNPTSKYLAYAQRSSRIVSQRGPEGRSCLLRDYRYPFLVGEPVL